MVFLAFFLLCSEIGAGGDLDLNQILERNHRAMGGDTLLDQVQRLEYHVEIGEGETWLTGIYRTDRRGMMRVDIYHQDKHVFTEAYDGKEGWQWTPDRGREPMSAKGLNNFLNGYEQPGHFFTIKNARDRGHAVKNLGRAKFAGVDCYKVQLDLKSGLELTYFISRDSFLILGRGKKASLHPDLDPTEQHMQSTLSRYRKYGKLTRAERQIKVDKDTGAVIQQTLILDLKMNPSFKEGVFSRLK